MQRIIWVVVNHATPTNALFHNLRLQSFTQLLHVPAVLFRHLQGADIKISLKCAAIKQAAVYTHVVLSVVQNFISFG